MDYSLLLAIEEVNEKSIASKFISPPKNLSFNANKLNVLNINKIELSKSVEINDLNSLDNTIK